MSREDKYTSSKDNDDMQALTDKLTADLRKNIRQLGDFPVMSEEWLEMSKSIERIATITDMEKKMPKKSEDATLWECEEQALRFILEDGKINLCLRLLVAAKEYETDIIKTKEMDKNKFDALDRFKKGLGILLKNAWLHVESLQTTDLPLLIEYIGVTLEYAIDHPEYIENNKMKNASEILILYYLLCLMKRIDDISENRIMPLLMEKRIFEFVVCFLQIYWKLLSMEDLSTGTEALALICDTEDFQTHINDYIVNDQTKDALISIKEDFMDDMINEPNERKKLRSLLDTIKEYS